MNAFERIAHWLLAGSKEGRNRARILVTLNRSPMNSNRKAMMPLIKKVIGDES